MPTKERIEKVKSVLSLRQPDLRVVLEEVTNTHNASAVVRTCDAAGILYVDIISRNKEPLLVNEAISTRAEKWIQLNYYSSASECFASLRKKGFKIVATHLGEETLSYTELDYTQTLAIVFGNESEGISEEALSLADYRIKIPLLGMAQSLNLSVSVGVILYEALRQRKEKGIYQKKNLSPDELEKFFKEWLDLSPQASSETD